jgi:hypothetical protein
MPVGGGRGRVRDEGDLIGEAEEVECGEAGRWVGGGGRQVAAVR